MKPDITTRADIEMLLEHFYAVIIYDDEIGHHFDGLDMEKHLPIITDFWEKVLFGAPVYFGNPLAIHQMLNEKSPLKFEHFIRWVEVFSQKIDEFFEGEMADTAKLRAEMIGRSLNERLNGGVKIQKNF